jgi:hypothetical protein
VQYCSNDAAENIAYIENKFQYQAPTLAKYEETVLVNLENKTYYPYKYTFNLLKSIFKKVKNPINRIKSVKLEFFCLSCQGLTILTNFRPM